VSSSYGLFSFLGGREGGRGECSSFEHKATQELIEILAETRGGLRGGREGGREG